MSDLELENRQLCPDGACIGVIGHDGRCKVCGRAADGSAPARSETPEPFHEVEADAAPEAAPGDEAAPADFADRQLCPDGACIGVIGPDGRCKVCGTVAASS